MSDSLSRMPLLLGQGAVIQALRVLCRGGVFTPGWSWVSGYSGTPDFASENRSTCTGSGLGRYAELPRILASCDGRLSVGFSELCALLHPRRPSHSCQLAFVSGSCG